MSVQEHAGNDKSCVWHARDFSDGELKDELFCIRFASVESECESYILYFFAQLIGSHYLIVAYSITDLSRSCVIMVIVSYFIVASFNVMITYLLHFLHTVFA